MPGFPLIIVPDPDEAEAAEILVDGTIQDKPYRFLLDTGAARTSVLWDAYTSTLASTEQTTSSGVFARNSNDLVTLRQLTLGTIMKDTITAVRSNENGQEKHPLIGMDILKDVCLHACFDDAWVAVDPTINDTAYVFHDLLLDKTHHPYIDVRFGAAIARAVWDTGASITIVDMNVIKAHPASFTKIGQSTGTDATGASMESAMYRMEGAVIGGCIFPAHTVAGIDLSFANATIDVPMELILGYSTLRHAHWLVDFPRKRWTITKQIMEYSETL